MNKEGAIERMRELLDVPFVHQGCGPRGTDCVGAIVWAFQYKGPVPAYPIDPVRGELERQLERVFGPPVLEKPFDIGDLRVGDVVCMEFAGPSRHVGLVADHDIPGELSLIHTSAMHARVVEHRIDDRWKRRIVKVYRP